MRNAIAELLGSALLVAAFACGAEDASNCADADCAEATTTGGGSPSASAGSGGEGAHGGGAPTPAEEYCGCMLDSCHDAYHDVFGPESDEAAAFVACIELAESLPVAGMEVDAGNFVECRIHYCHLGADDETACPNAVGDAVCI